MKNKDQNNIKLSRSTKKRKIILETKCLHKHFDGTKAVNGVSLAIEEGSIVSLIGPNGAGKTTLFNVVTGFLSADAGKVVFDGIHMISKMAPYNIARLGIGRTFQDLRLIRRLTAMENVCLALPNQKGDKVIGALFGRRNREEKRRRAEAMNWLGYIGIGEEANTLAEELSYGQQKLLTVACCLALGSRLLLLDEPVAGVNPALAEKILELLLRLRNEEAKTILVVEHNMDAVMKVSDRVVAMDEGQIIADGKPKQILESAAVIEAYLE